MKAVQSGPTPAFAAILVLALASGAAFADPVAAPAPSEDAMGQFRIAVEKMASPTAAPARKGSALASPAVPAEPAKARFRILVDPTGGIG